MYELIKNFARQFDFEPILQNAGRMGGASFYVVAGMGGSALSARLLKLYKPDIPLAVHNNYGLLYFPGNIYKNVLVVASSYSGNTEETIDAYDTARAKNLACAVVATGGELLEKAKLDGIPYVELPQGLPPRLAVGYSFLALLKILGDEQGLADAKELSSVLDSQKCEETGKLLANNFQNKIPVMYASQRNEALAYIWKIIINETALRPAFYNVFPELNHNEMAGFETASFSDHFRFIFLRDDEDQPKIQKRMDVLAALFKEKKLSVDFLILQGKTPLEKIFSTTLLAHWTGYFLASDSVVAVPKSIEAFKKML